MTSSGRRRTLKRIVSWKIMIPDTQLRWITVIQCWMLCW